jgi:hypothetical protein
MSGVSVVDLPSYAPESSVATAAQPCRAASAICGAPDPDPWIPITGSVTYLAT